MSEAPAPPPQGPRPRRHRALKIVAATVGTILVVVLAGGFLVYRHLNGNITAIAVTPGGLGTDRPTKKVEPTTPSRPDQPLNILLIGSDTRQGKGNHLGGQTPGLSDTTILMHVSADRKLAYGVSLPRDSMVQRPDCRRKDGQGSDPGGLSMFNEAYAVGGALCTVRTVESLTRIRIDHFVVVDFNGFKQMVDALNGVEVCVPTPVNDTTGHIKLKAGTYDVKGAQALDYVRVRHDLGTAENGDIGRMRRQQSFLASMANKAISAGTLLNPARLYQFLDAATKSLSTDPGLASLSKLTGLAESLRGIGLSHIQFLTVPFEAYAPDPNRLEWAPSAHQLWTRIIDDKPIGKKLLSGVTTAENKNGKPPTHHKRSTAATRAAAASAREQAAENGLCG